MTQALVAAADNASGLPVELPDLEDDFLPVALGRLQFYNYEAPGLAGVAPQVI